MVLSHVTAIQTSTNQPYTFSNVVVSSIADYQAALANNGLILIEYDIAPTATAAGTTTTTAGAGTTATSAPPTGTSNSGAPPVQMSDVMKLLIAGALAYLFFK